MRSRIIAVSLFTLYCLFGFVPWVRTGGYAYVNNNGRYLFINRHWIILVTGALLVGLSWLLGFKRLFPKQYLLCIDKKKGQSIVMLVALFIPCFLLNFGVIVSINSFWKPDIVRVIKGIVMERQQIRGRGTTYYVLVRDTTAAVDYEFMVSGIVYENTTLYSPFEKQFHVDKLGDLYREEP